MTKYACLSSVLEQPSLAWMDRIHCIMPSCDYFPYFNIRSCILFPSFALNVDGSMDSLVCFKSIGGSTMWLCWDPPDFIFHSKCSKGPFHSIKDHDKVVSSTPLTLTQTSSDIMVYDLNSNSCAPLSTCLISSFYHNPTSITEVPPVFTPSPSKHCTFDHLKLQTF